MKRRFVSLWAAVLGCLLLLPLLTATAYADSDRIESYDVVAAPQVKDGSILFTVTLDWTVLEDLDEGVELKVGIPNGSIREAQALTDNITYLTNDNSYMFIYLDRAYKAGETVHFAYSWVQEYMYTMDENNAVSFEYTPGWFDEIRVGHMTVTWQENDGLDGEVTFYADDSDCWTVEGMTLVGAELPYGSQVHFSATYDQWPTQLSDEMSADRMPDEYAGYGDYDFDYNYSSDSGGEEIAVIIFLIVLVVVLVIIGAASRHDGYAGGFGTRYVYVNHLWYPAGADGRPKPGSVGVPKKPEPPVTHHSSGGGFGGGSRGGGFGGGGFGGGSHCACASSCACACACACAGGGRAGCSAKNLYGAVHLDQQVTDRLEG